MEDIISPAQIVFDNSDLKQYILRYICMPNIIQLSEIMNIKQFDNEFITILKKHGLDNQVSVVKEYIKMVATQNNWFLGGQISMKKTEIITLQKKKDLQIKWNNPLHMTPLGSLGFAICDFAKYIYENSQYK